MRILFTTLLLLFGTCLSSFAQTPTWQWGRRGGSNASNENESIRDIATDPNGNVYILSQVNYTAGGSATLDVAGNAVVGKGYRDVLLSSFTCTGAYRWSKVFGGTQNDYSVNLETDTLGGVYFTARFNNINNSIDLASDTTLSISSTRSIFLVKYDTSGNYKWVARPQSDTTKLTDNSNSFGLQVDGGGNVYWLAHLLPNSYGNGTFQVNSYSLNVLKYNKNGVFQGGIPMDIVADIFPVYYQKLFFTRDHKSGSMYISGYAKAFPITTLSFGVTNVINAMFIGKFSSTGTSLWTKQNNFSGSGRFLTEVTLDDSSNLYVAGNSLPGDGFAGSGAFTNSYGNQTIVSLFAKLDSNGNLRQISNSNNRGVVNECHGTYVNGKFVLAGGFSINVEWPGLNDSVTKKIGGGDLGIYVTHFDAATGQPLALDSLVSTNTTRLSADIVHAERKGNVYFGGQMDRGVVVAGSTLNSAGSQSTDFFLAKYGYSNCNCVPPTAAITQRNFNNATRSVNFQYSGSTYGVDSVVWTWGNNLPPITLTNNFTVAIPRFYGTDTGTYNVCVTAYTNGCGSSKVCTVLRFTPLGVGQLGTAGGATMALAPNPATNAVQVAYSLLGTAGSLEVYDLAGRLLTTKALRQKAGAETVVLTEFAAGVYMVVLREEGRVMAQQRLVVGK